MGRYRTRRRWTNGDGSCGKDLPSQIWRGDSISALSRSPCQTSWTFIFGRRPAQRRNVHAGAALPWDVEDLRSLASVSSASLTSLHLAPDEKDHHPGLTKLSFADLRSLVELVRSELPLLQDLSITLNGVEDAETHCRDLQGCLEDGGTISKLLIVCARPWVPLFNVLRSLSTILTSTAYIGSAKGSDGRRDNVNGERIECLAYLRG